MSQEWEKELVEGLVEAGEKNIDLEGRDSVQEAMENLAEPIARAIKDGSSFSIKGSATVDEINELQKKSDGDVWVVKDDGIIYNDNLSEVYVEKGDLVRYDGGKWSVVFHMEMEGYVTEDQLNSAVASLTALVAAEETARKNSDDDLDGWRMCMKEGSGTATLRFYYKKDEDIV